MLHDPPILSSFERPPDNLASSADNGAACCAVVSNLILLFPSVNNVNGILTMYSYFVENTMLPHTQTGLLIYLNN